MSKPGCRRWRDKFGEAGRGIVLAVRESHSCAIHAFAAVLVVVAAVALECDRVEWCLLIGCIGAVFAAEVFNASIETLFHALDDATKSRMTGCLDRAAGAVLVVAITAIAIGMIVLGRRWLLYAGW